MLRKLFLIFVAIWLPVQAGAALAMSAGSMAPSQPHGQADGAMAHDHDGVGHHGGHATHVTDDGAAQHEGHEQGASGTCERCGLCQFVHGGVMLNAGGGLPAISPLWVFEVPAAERFTAHTPELLQRPPLSAA